MLPTRSKEQWFAFDCDGIPPLQVLVHSVDELRVALQDENVDHIVMANSPGNYSLSEENFPHRAAVIAGRTVTVEGEGPGMVYVDVSARAARGPRVNWMEGAPSADLAAGLGPRQPLPSAAPTPAPFPHTHCRGTACGRGSS